LWARFGDRLLFGVKVSGLYSRHQFESEVSQTERAFDFGGVAPGLYILTCVAGKKVVALEVLRISAGTAPFAINYKPGQGVGESAAID
jgi:hypothetical protein